MDRVAAAERAQRSVDRVKAFTDAVVAIAFTLLALPLLDGVPEMVRQHEAVAEWLVGHTPDLAYFVLSFVLIGRAWLSHEHVFSYTEAMTPALHRANFVWMFAIVLMPVVTALLSAHADVAQVSLYIGTMLLSAVALAELARRTGRLPGSQMPPSVLAASLASVLLMAAALLVGVLVASLAPEYAGAGYCALALLFLTGPLGGRLTTVGERVLRRG